MFEKHVLKNHNEPNIDHPLKFERNGNPNFRKYIVNGILTKTKNTPPSEIIWLGNIEDFTDISTDEIKNMSKNTQKAYLLILLRNKFGHNQLPSKEAYNLMQTLYSKEDKNSSSFYKVAQQIINEFSM